MIKFQVKVKILLSISFYLQYNNKNVRIKDTAMPHDDFIWVEVVLKEWNVSILAGYRPDYHKIILKERTVIITCSVIQAMASMTRATTSERRIARNALLTDRDSVMLPDDATAALLLIPAVSINRNFCKKDDDLVLEGIKIGFVKERQALKLICTKICPIVSILLVCNLLILISEEENTSAQPTRNLKEGRPTSTIYYMAPLSKIWTLSNKIPNEPPVACK